MFWVFFLTGSLRAGLMSCVSSTVHPKVSLCVILCGKETQKKKKKKRNSKQQWGQGGWRMQGKGGNHAALKKEKQAHVESK